MRRRAFISLLGGAAVAWPLAARAQGPERMPRIAVMEGFPEDNREGRQEIDALRDGLRELGWIDGRSARIDFYWDVGEPDRAELVGKDVVAAHPDVIVTHSTTVSRALSRLTKSIPIVFVNVLDPVASGLVANFARPEGNVTGFANFEPSMSGKWVEILKDVVPQIRRVTILFNPETAPSTKYFLPSFKAAGSALGVETVEGPVRSAAEIDKAIEAVAREPNGSLIAMSDIFTGQNKPQIVRAATDHRLPLIAAYRNWTEDGALLSYGSDNVGIFRTAAAYVDRILKGTKPADLPVQAPTKFEMIINLKTAKALGLTVSRDFLLRADEVIE